MLRLEANTREKGAWGIWPPTVFWYPGEQKMICGPNTAMWNLLWRLQGHLKRGLGPFPPGIYIVKSYICSLRPGFKLTSQRPCGGICPLLWHPACPGHVALAHLEQPGEQLQASLSDDVSTFWHLTLLGSLSHHWLQKLMKQVVMAVKWALRNKLANIHTVNPSPFTPKIQMTKWLEVTPCWV